ncbi:hypothetical protein PVA44_02610 [Entomospira nematocerorum]|uniref:Outer membrane protein beta-barrel domain-containing protein n=1 Tax=Entomospira nematocerorum TaxID=2719987 RepID=A0A968KUA8_9SPIO|nr:hypothetical protein [Entomospira nematocera]NIZ47074.1 hypothetical protein [Entomospira nematocera]WDI34381.1 hypothetical protein PVA44_02610 [Entomospira nematocera]
MKHYYRIFLLFLSLFCFNVYANEDDPYDDTKEHPLSLQYKPKYVLGFFGVDIGGGLTQEPLSTFNMSVHGGITFFYKDLQKNLMSSVLGLFVNTSLYGGFDFNLSKSRFAWAPKIGVSQLLGPIIVGLETLFYTNNNFKTYDLRLFPYFGISYLNIFSITVGPSIHVAGNVHLPQVSRWRAYLTIRIPIELIYYFMGL